MKIYKCIGLMSGTSLDGLDIAYCEFKHKDNWKYEIKVAETVSYGSELKERLRKIKEASALELMELHVELGRLFGKHTNVFIKKHDLEPDFIASHGHTIFHQPSKGLTLQIGNGYEIFKYCGIKTICDFRSLDVTLGGQGAPLVPIGDKMLFKDFDFCLNLGGISNISFDKNDLRTAYDIAPHNMILNYLANKIGKEYDPSGQIASNGNLDKHLLQKLNAIDYYKMPFPKSLGSEYIEKTVIPIIENSPISIEDKLHTFNHHIADQINKEIINVLPKFKTGKLLVTGGGAYNDYFLQLLRQYSKDKYIVHVPDKNTIDYKEALIFSFLGVLKIRNEINVLKSVTGAIRDSCSGVILEG